MRWTEERNGKKEGGIRWLCAQLQGLHRYARVGHGRQAHRPLGDDEEDLGVREEKAPRQEIVRAEPDRIVLSLPGAFRTFRLRFPQSGLAILLTGHSPSTPKQAIRHP